MRVPRISPARSRVLAFFAWLAALYVCVSVLLINFGGVSFPLPTPGHSKSQLGNIGLEILSWLNDGDDDSIANYYHYRLYLNRLCAVNPSKQRGNGQCHNPGVLGAFRLSTYAPDAFVRSQRGYDAVVGRIDLLTPFALWALAAGAAAAALAALPATFLADGAGGHSPPQIARRSRAAMLVLAAAVAHAAASASLTVQLARLTHWIQYVPQVSHVWLGRAPLAMSWAGSAALLAAALALQDDVAVARRACRANFVQQRAAFSPGLGPADAFVADVDAAWDVRSPAGGVRHWWLDYPLLRGAGELVLWLERRRRRRRSSAAMGKSLEQGGGGGMADGFGAGRKMG